MDKKSLCSLLNNVSKFYWGRMYKYIKDNNVDIKDVNCFILNPESIVLYFSKRYLAIEYCGNPLTKELPEISRRDILYRDFTKEDIDTKQFVEKIIGFKYDSNSNISLPLETGIYENLIIPTNAGMDKLCDLKWNFAAQEYCCFSFNSQGLDIPDDQNVRLINCSFFDSKNGDLKTRLIKWIDFIPLKYIENYDEENDRLMIDFTLLQRSWYEDLLYKYPEPNDFKYGKLPKINKFIELFGDTANSETDITSFLEKEENSFILNMAFMGIEAHCQLECEWQSEDRNKIIPDFFIVRSNGYADIVEFKLPTLHDKTLVGRPNREQFNAQINSYIAQTRVYKIYFDDPNNRRWFKNKYKFNVYNPRRYLVIGRRNDFSSEIWMEIKSEYRDLDIITYDDLIDTVITQFYQ